MGIILLTALIKKKKGFGFYSITPPLCTYKRNITCFNCILMTAQLHTYTHQILAVASGTYSKRHKSIVKFLSMLSNLILQAPFSGKCQTFATIRSKNQIFI